MNGPKVYVVILNYKNWQDTIECLASVFQSSYKNFSIIVIDNNSQNNSLEHLINWAQYVAGIDYILFNTENIAGLDNVVIFPALTFIQNNSNRGFGAGNNIILQRLQYEDAYVWLLNPDMIVREDTMRELVKFALEGNEHLIIGSVIKRYPDKTRLLFYGGGRIIFSSAIIKMAKDSADIAKLDFISGGCLFTHAISFKRNGLLPEKYFLYWEETDWCYYAGKNGCLLKVCTTAVCYDKISSIIGKGYLANYYYTINGLRFTATIRKLNKIVILFFLSLRFLKRVVTGRWAGAKGLYNGAKDYFKLNVYDTK